MHTGTFKYFDFVSKRYDSFPYLLFIGMGVNLLLINPEKAIKLAVNDQVRQMYGGKR